MTNKRTIKNAITIRRVVKKVEATELREWGLYFKMHGTKTDFEIATGISRRTIENVLKNKKGEERVITAIRLYYQSQQQTA